MPDVQLWLVVSWLAAIAVTIAYIALKNSKAYHLDWLCLMLWGLAIMTLVDRSIGFVVEGGEFIEVTTEGYVQNGTLLGVMMLMPIFFAWGAMVVIFKAKRSSKGLEAR
jgi:hypothetical protein